MKILIEKEKPNIIFLVVIIVVPLLATLLDVRIRDALMIGIVPTVLIFYAFFAMKRRRSNYIHVNDKVFVCKDSKRNIDIEIPKEAIKASLYLWKKEEWNKTIDVPVIKIEANGGRSVSFAAGDYYGFEWTTKKDYIDDFDIKLEHEEWQMLINALKLSAQLRTKPVVIPENARRIVVKIMYVFLFGAIGFGAWFLYWAIYVEKFFEV